MLLIRPTVIRRYVNSRKKKISKAALNQINVAVAKLIDKAVENHNGGRVTIDAELIEICRTRYV